MSALTASAMCGTHELNAPTRQIIPSFFDPGEAKGRAPIDTVDGASCTRHAMFGSTQSYEEIGVAWGCVREAGLAGIEARLPLTADGRTALLRDLKEHELDYIAIVASVAPANPGPDGKGAPHALLLKNLHKRYGEHEVLFDEPTSALDPELVGDVLNVIGELAKEGMTMIIVTHEMDFAMSISDRIVFMENGVIKLDAAPDAIRHQDGAERVRRFIGVIKEGKGAHADQGVSVALGF